MALPGEKRRKIPDHAPIRLTGRSGSGKVVRPGSQPALPPAFEVGTRSCTQGRVGPVSLGEKSAGAPAPTARVLKHEGAGWPRRTRRLTCRAAVRTTGS